MLSAFQRMCGLFKSFVDSLMTVVEILSLTFALLDVQENLYYNVHRQILDRLKILLLYTYWKKTVDNNVLEG